MFFSDKTLTSSTGASSVSVTCSGEFFSGGVLVLLTCLVVSRLQDQIQEQHVQ